MANLMRLFMALAYRAADGWCAACARRELAPLALNAYPEAYCDFKQTMQVRRCYLPAGLCLA